MHHFGVKLFMWLCLVLFKVDLLPSSVCCCTVAVGRRIMSVCLYSIVLQETVLLLKFLLGCCQNNSLTLQTNTHSVYAEYRLLYKPLWS